MADPIYKRVLLKISGEALAGGKGTGLDFRMIESVCEVIRECLAMGGGGHFWRGAKNQGVEMERTRADHMGMLATIMNSLAIADVCERMDIPVRVQTAINMFPVAEVYEQEQTLRQRGPGNPISPRIPPRSSGRCRSARRPSSWPRMWTAYTAPTRSWILRR